MGKPKYPTQAQLQDLRRAAELPAPEWKNVEQGRISLQLPPHGLALVEIAQ